MPVYWGSKRISSVSAGGVQQAPTGPELVPVEVQLNNATKTWIQFDFQAEVISSNPIVTQAHAPARSMCVISASAPGGTSKLTASIGVTVSSGMTYKYLANTTSSSTSIKAGAVVAVDVGTSGGTIILKRVLGSGDIS